MKIDNGKAINAIEDLLGAMGVDHTKEPYLGTAKRYVRFLHEMFETKESNIKTFPEEFDGVIAIRNHDAWSLCPHHLLPVCFSIDVTYKPIGHTKVNVLGLSKLPRVIDSIVREGPALQERVTQRIIEKLKPYSDFVQCVVRGSHLCAQIRGVKSNGTMITEAKFQRQQPGKVLLPDVN